MIDGLHMFGGFAGIFQALCKEPVWFCFSYSCVGDAVMLSVTWVHADLDFSEPNP